MNRTSIKISLILALLIVAGCRTESEKPQPVATQKPLVVFLVRHAEKTEDSKDPELSEAGIERAAELAETLRSSNIEYIHSSDYKRTRNTAEPVGKELEKETSIYDPGDLPALAKKLKETGGRHLVVGHSNTTPELTKLLGGEPGAEIDEKGEYDRLYVVTIGKDGTANSATMRYGEPFEPKKEEE